MEFVSFKKRQIMLKEATLACLQELYIQDEDYFVPTKSVFENLSKKLGAVTSGYIGRCVIIAFPTVKNTTRRDQADWSKFVRVYSGLREIHTSEYSNSFRIIRHPFMMEDSEEHQCRVCDMIFHSYDELEGHCSLHIKKENSEITPGSEIMSTFTISSSADSVVDSKVGIRLVPKTEASENCTKLPEPLDTTKVLQGPELSNIKVENFDSNVLSGTIVPSIIKIKVEKPDQATLQSYPQPNQAVLQSGPQSEQTVVQSGPQSKQTVVQSDPQPSSSNQIGLTRLIKQPLIITRPTEPSEIVLKFPNIFSAISKPPAISENQPKATVAKRKQGDNVKGRVIKRCRLPETGFACHLCGEKFNKKDKLRQHMHSHMKEKFFKCDICGEKYLNQAQLDQHRPKHFFKCENCDLGFVKYADLKAHSATHDSVSKFTCFICRKNFPYKSVLMAHIDIHNTGAFECDHCYAKFNGRSQLSKHYFAHHSTAQKETLTISKPVPSGNASTNNTPVINGNSTKIT